MRWITAVMVAFLIAVFPLGLTSPIATNADDDDPSHRTMTPIRHIVVIFDENNSFDHYFGTYPTAQNLPGEPEGKS